MSILTMPNLTWISVKDRAPTEEENNQNSGWFLVCSKNWPRAWLVRYEKCEELMGDGRDHGWKADYIGEEITHWMELPLPIKGLKKEKENP